MAKTDRRREPLKADTPQTEVFVRTKRRKVLAIEDTPASRDSRDGQSSTEQLMEKRRLKQSSAATSGLTNTQDEGPDAVVVDPESIVCAVCGSNAALEEDPLILCDGQGGRCNLVVHVTCYSVNITDMAAQQWFCDPCLYRQSSSDINNIGTTKQQQVRCSACLATSGALKRIEFADAWACVQCPPNKKNRSVPSAKRLIQMPPRPLPRRRRPLTDANPAAAAVNRESDDDDEILPKKKRRQKVMTKYVLDEAEGSSDASDDDDDPDLLRAIEEEEEAAQDEFINDSSQLGYTQGDDELDAADPEDDNDDFGPSHHHHHAALDAARERLRRFDTPLLNRRVRDKKTWSCSQETAGSERSSGDRGLGNMHFIRSVLEHHRRGGDANDIENVYQELAAAEGVAEVDDESP